MIGAAEWGVLGLIFLGLWAAWQGLVDSIAYSKYQKEQEEKQRKEQNRK